MFHSIIPPNPGMKALFKCVRYIHKNFTRTNNRLIFKNLDLKLEKKFWGDKLDFLRNNDVIMGMENIKKEINNAIGMANSCMNPIDHAHQLNDEIIENKAFFGLTNEQWIFLINMAMIKSFIDNSCQKEK